MLGELKILTQIPWPTPSRAEIGAILNASSVDVGPIPESMSICGERHCQVLAGLRLCISHIKERLTAPADSMTSFLADRTYGYPAVETLTPTAVLSASNNIRSASVCG